MPAKPYPSSNNVSKGENAMKFGNIFKNLFNRFTKQTIPAQPKITVHEYPPEPLPEPKHRRIAKPRRYKRAFTCGYRGWPRSHTPPGLWPAPTIDQVRFLERSMGVRLHVKAGDIYIRDTGERLNLTF
jgi:hypothetical protein